MIGKVILKRIGGYDPRLGHDNFDPTLEEGTSSTSTTSSPLTAKQHEALTLRESGHSLRSIAGILHISRNAVIERLKRAKAALEYVK